MRRTSARSGSASTSVSTDLERFSDCVENVAERTIEVGKGQPAEPARSVLEVGRGRGR